MSLERSYGEYPKPKGLGRSCCSHGFRREALPRRPHGAPQRLDFALTFETYPQVALRNTACPLAALMRSVFRRILANLRSCQSGTNTSWDGSQHQ